MTTTTLHADDAPARMGVPAAAPPPAGTVERKQAYRLTATRVLRSEWLKAGSLRSTWLTLAGVFTAIAGFGLIAAAMAGSGDTDVPGPNLAGGTALDTVLSGANMAVLIVGVLGALMGAREYASGMIRTTLATAPRRLLVLASKLAVFVAIVTPAVLLALALAVTIGMPILESAGRETMAWGDEGVLRAVLGTGAYLVGIGMAGLALGVLLRSIAGSIGLLLGGVLFVPTLAAALLPDGWTTVLQYLPASAGAVMMSTAPPEDGLGVLTAAVVFVGWVALAVIGAGVAVRIRDV